MVVTAPTYLQLIVEDLDRHWELHNGRLREKPDMAYQHNRSIFLLHFELSQQLNLDDYEIRVNSARAARPTETYYIPDLMVIPLAVSREFWSDPARTEIYEAPLPLVVEVWSPSTGDYDIDEKLPEYQARGDAEIWRLHISERTLNSFTRQSGGTYRERVYHEADTIRLIALSGVEIAVSDLFR